MAILLYVLGAVVVVLYAVVSWKVADAQVKAFVALCSMPSIHTAYYLALLRQADRVRSGRERLVC